MNEPTIDPNWGLEAATPLPTPGPTPEGPTPARGPVCTAVEANVLARFPEVAAAEPTAEGKDCPASPPGRLISQRLSAKLLLGGGLLLVLAAIVPFLFSKKDDAKPGNNSTPTWEPGPPAPMSDWAMKWKQGSQATPRAPVARLGGVRGVSPESGPGKPDSLATGPKAGPLLPPPAASGDAAGRGPSREQAPLASTWPDPTRSPPGEGRLHVLAPPQADANRSMSVGAGGLADRRTPLPPYQAGLGTGAALPAEPGVARFEGTIESPPSRNADDRARPGLY
jgi:hypothetical protein